MYYLVYKITNKVNNKIYIGVHKTNCINDGYMGSGTLLMRAIDKHGIDNFVKEVLFEASSAEEMFDKERELVEIGKHTYNIKNGGEGGFDYINNVVFANGKGEEIRRKISLALKGKLTKEKSPWYGKHLYEETKRKISQKNKGNKSFTGRKHTEETKLKMSLSSRGKHTGSNGTCWITRDNINKRIKIDVLNDYLSQGWRKGRYFSEVINQYSMGIEAK